MQAVEKTIQNLVGSGMDPKTQNNPYYGFIYTSFQERATKVFYFHQEIACMTGGFTLIGANANPRGQIIKNTNQEVWKLHG